MPTATRFPTRLSLALGGVAVAAALAAALTLAPATGALAQASAPAASAATGSVSAADKRFADQAAAGGLAEVELGKLAADHASTDAVRQFGARMVEDHGKANDELASLARSKGLSLPTVPEAAQRKAVQRLQAMKGAAFDHAFMRRMIADHRKTIALFQKASTSAKDADIKDFATRTLPTLRSHLQMARDANKTVRAAARGAASAASS